MDTNKPKAQFKSFNKDALGQQITDHLLQTIRNGELGPGDKLPSERDLAVMMNVSRPSLREALRALSIMNVIEIRPGDGTYVSSLKTELLVQHLEFVFTLDDSTFFDLFYTRRTLEVGVVALAAERITVEEISELEHNQARAIVLWEQNPERNWEQNEELVALDRDFHRLILQAARHPLMSRLLSAISQLDLASRQRIGLLPGIRRQALADHDQILQALKAHDADAARTAMEAHLQHAETNLKQAISLDKEQN